VALASGTVHSAPAAGALLLRGALGIRYVHAAPVLRNVLVRTVAFFVSAARAGRFCRWWRAASWA
jgi:hypothetical protein